MEALKAGDEEAFAALYRRHAPRVYGFLVKKTADPALAQEILQEAWLKLFRFRFRYERGRPFMPWLYVLSRNALVDGLRRERRGAAAAPEETDPPAAAVRLPEDLLDRLSPREREVLRLRFEEDFTFKGIAARLSLSLANARKIGSRALAKIKGALL